MIFEMLRQSALKNNPAYRLPELEQDKKKDSFFSLPVVSEKKEKVGCGSGCGCKKSINKEAHPAMAKSSDGFDQVFNKKISRRSSFAEMTKALLVGTGLSQSACSITGDEASTLRWDEYFKKNYRLMTSNEKLQTVDRLQKLYEKRTGNSVNIATNGAAKNVLFGYAFNISKCQGYMDCVNACVEENNQDRSTEMQYIRIHEHKNGSLNFENSTDDFYHEVPAQGHFYMGTQCYHCENPPCVDVCPVKATWQEDDGIVVIDYDWCIGCRYCMAACPYDGRRFNWKEPEVPQEEVNKDQHYLGNRMRSKGVMEKCTFCIQKSRKGENPACVEACPTGARIFGNLLDPNSDIRWVLDNKKVFRLKEDLGTEPKFWYFMD